MDYLKLYIIIFFQSFSFLLSAFEVLTSKHHEEVINIVNNIFNKLEKKEENEEENLNGNIEAPKNLFLKQIIRIII